MKTLNELKALRTELTNEVAQCERKAAIGLRVGNRDHWKFWNDEAARIAAERDEVTVEHDAAVMAQ